MNARGYSAKYAGDGRSKDTLRDALSVGAAGSGVSILRDSGLVTPGCSRDMRNGHCAIVRVYAAVDVHIYIHEA